MNRREARSLALHHAWMILDAYQATGSDTLYDLYDEPDADKINTELAEITRRLRERSEDLAQ